MSCRKCHGTYWLLYQKPAPSPPYKEGLMLDYGVRCDECRDEPKRPNQNYKD